jgi:uncharacterized protein (DUF697 family)
MARDTGQWLSVLRDRINLSAVDARAKRSVRLLVAGADGDALIAALDPSGAGRGTILDRFETAPAWTVADETTRAVLYFAVGPEDEGAYARLAALALPAFIVEQTPRLGDIGNGLYTGEPREGRPAPGKPSHYPVSALNPIELRKHLLPDIVEACRDREIALAAALPIFRPVVAAKLTIDCAMSSMYVAGASAVADHIPIIGFITGGIASAGDTIAITAMQMNMLLNIAAAYGKPAGMARIAELLPVIGGGYGWRALARELSGFIPGVGILVKAAIAYAGTVVLGHAASYYYETGTAMAPDKISTLYREAVERAKRAAADVATRFKKKK